jgi:hypothetical protein
MAVARKTVIFEVPATAIMLVSIGIPGKVVMKGQQGSRQQSFVLPVLAGIVLPSQWKIPLGRPFVQQPPMENEQSRKKRNNKSRRTVDFPQDSMIFPASRGSDG